MENLILVVYPGDNFTDVANLAQAQAHKLNCTVQFDFNEIICIVSKDTDLVNLHRYYSDAHTMEWKTVGPICDDTYSKEIQDELEHRISQDAERTQEKNILYEKEKEFKKIALNNKINGLTIQLKDEIFWLKQKEINNDSFGMCIMEYAERWALLMQFEIANGANLKDIADSTCFEADVEDITGFMHNSATQDLIRCWVYGDELCKWHNKSYNYEGDGVVNSSIITIKN